LQEARKGTEMQKKITPRRACITHFFQEVVIHRKLYAAIGLSLAAELLTSGGFLLFSRMK
jgi:hypothetical protein